MPKASISPNLRGTRVGFSQLKDKVEQAEKALEANERVVASDWRVLKQSWRAAWTPGRIVIAGLASGFLVGRAEPLSKTRASGIINMLTALGGLFASGTAAGAADDAKKAATRVEENVHGVPPGSAPLRTADVAPVPEDVMRVRTHEKLREAGLL